MRPHTRPARARQALRRSGTRPGSSPLLLEERAGAAVDGSSPGLAVELRADLVRPRVTVAGELDLSSAGLLSAMLDHVRTTRRRERAGQVEVDVDLSRVTFADSSGLAPVLDGRARVVAASAPVRRLLRLLAEEPLHVRSTA